MAATLGTLAALRRAGTPQGLASICSAHPLVLRAALRNGRRTGGSVLIEATCNQVNHQGGYTGMRPADFAARVRDLARLEGCPMERVVLGGDHLGPNPWRAFPVEDAMAEARQMVAEYVNAGFTKIHLDASMGCRGESAALDDTTTAHRAADLADVAETTARNAGLPPLHYIIGTEVPPPGGADHTLDTVAPTTPDAARQTLAVHREVFGARGLGAVLDRIMGLVVQPGVEFGNRNVIRYAPERAHGLVAVLDDHPDLIFEAHSTDYQGVQPLSQLVHDGFAILKVGPALTFRLREALYALDMIATDLVPDYGARPLYHAMERLMLAEPEAWQSHYPGDPNEKRLMRHYSLSDRIRYYWATDAARQAVARTQDALRGRRVPLPLIWQHLPAAAAAADAPLDPDDLLISHVMESEIATYHAAANP